MSARPAHRWWPALDSLAADEELTINLAVSAARYAKDWKTYLRYLENELSLRFYSGL